LGFNISQLRKSSGNKINVHYATSSTPFYWTTGAAAVIWQNTVATCIINCRGDYFQSISRLELLTLNSRDPKSKKSKETSWYGTWCVVHTLHSFFSISPNWETSPPPPLPRHIFYIYVFYVNLAFARVYNPPQTFVYNPPSPHLKFLKITMGVHTKLLCLVTHIWTIFTSHSTRYEYISWFIHDLSWFFGFILAVVVRLFFR